jgi:8-oxo-dGTP pyrophosphatase MutT (NUDIX family)
VSAFILNDAGQLLLIRRSDNGLYAIPGGGQEVGETITQTVVREVHEETGVTVEVTGLIGIYSDPAHVIAYDDGEVRQEFSLCFRAHPLTSETRTSDESTEVLWADPDKIADLTIHPSIRIRIQHGYENRDQPYYT